MSEVPFTQLRTITTYGKANGRKRCSDSTEIRAVAQQATVWMGHCILLSAYVFLKECNSRVKAFSTIPFIIMYTTPVQTEINTTRTGDRYSKAVFSSTVMYFRQKISYRSIQNICVT